MTSKRGQRQPYRVCTNFPPSHLRPEGGRVVDSYVSLTQADHKGCENARRGGTSEMLYLTEEKTFLRMFVYSPDNVAAFENDPEHVRVYLDEDIIRWYRKHHGAPELIEGLTERNIRTIDRPVPDGTPADKAVPFNYPQDDEVETSELQSFRRPPADEEAPMTTQPLAAADDMTDEELWNSPIGQRLRTYADKLLLAEQERMGAFHKRNADALLTAGISRSRAVIHPLGDPSPLSDGGNPDAVLRPEVDPWADWQSPEVVGLREAIAAADNTQKAAQEVAKAYFASLQGDERPAPDEEPTETAPAADEEPWTVSDVAGALSHLLKGYVLSDRGPFVVHEGDGFHPEPYVMLPLTSMGKVLDEIPKERW